MPKRKSEPEMTEQQRRQWQENLDRKTHDFFGFWMMCNEKPCARARSCVGETRPCFQRHWPHVPEEPKNWYRAFIKACAGGVSKQEAARLADAEMVRIAALDAPLQSRGDAA